LARLHATARARRNDRAGVLVRLALDTSDVAQLVEALRTTHDDERADALQHAHSVATRS
jgi:hypothetical protein